MSQGEQEADDGINAAVATGAVILGAADGVMNVAADNVTLAAKLIEPGSQRYIAHPLNDFVTDISGVWQALTTPGDMNIKHSVHPIDSALNVHGAFVTATADNFTQQGFVQGLRTSSAVAAGVIVETIDPFKKLKTLDTVADAVADAPKAIEILQAGVDVKPMFVSWNTYEHLLGNGSQPPKLKPLRDFSGLMDYCPPKPYDINSHLTYAPDHNKNKIIMDLEHEWDNELPPNIKHTTLDFIVRADEKLQQEHGNGPEMFHSALRLIQDYGKVKIDRIDGKWSRDGTLATNYDAFAKAREQGATVKEAASNTPTGRWAGDAGFTDVGGKHFNAAIRSEKLPKDLHPEFTRPVFSDNPAYQTYGEKWASSQGRSHQDLVSRHNIQDPPKTLSTLQQELAVLPKNQADEVWRYIEEHFAKQLDASGINIDPEFK